MTVRACVVSSLEVLSLGVYFIVQVLLWLWRAEGEAASCSLLRHDFLVMFFCFFLLTVCILVTDDVVGRGLREDIPRHMDMERTSIVDARRTGQAEVLRQKLQADNIRNLT